MAAEPSRNRDDSEIIKVGPWGGEGGYTWGDNDGKHSGIRQIRVSYDGVAIGSIQIEYDDNGKSVWSGAHDGNTGNEQIQFDCAELILKSISGFHDTYIRRLACESDFRMYGPYGSQHENNFESHPKGDWQIVGFHGRSDAYLRAIGVYLKNLVPPPPMPVLPKPIPVGPQRISVCPEPILVGPQRISVGPSGGDGGDSSHGLKLISVGPWGGDGGDTWDDVLYSGIHKIRVGYDQGAIVSIHIEYDNNGSTVWKEHGGSHHDKEIELDYPQEILTSISGYYDTYLRSLTFESNLKKKYGPYGIEEGTYFSFPISGRKIVSFYGRSDEYLRSIGVHLSNLDAAVLPLDPGEGEHVINIKGSNRSEEEGSSGGKEKGSKEREEERSSRGKEEGSRACEERATRSWMSVGPWGGKGGNKWDDRVHSGIHQIIVVYGDAIVSIHIEYDHNGSTIWKKHGGSSRGIIGKIQFDYPKEILTSISGYYDTCLRSLSFKSNLNKRYGPYGRQEGTYFSFPNSDGKRIVGFHGRSGTYLDCIGVYLSNFHTEVPPKSVKPISVGPWGGKGGNKWDDRVHSGIHQIIVVYGDAIDSIHIEYDDNGSTIWKEHGGRNGSKIEKIQLDYPKEILTSISGNYDTYLRSLTFKSNLNKEYGPYGRQQGMKFSFPISSGKIVGFHGRSGLYLDCIGVYLANLHTTEPRKSLKTISVGPWGGQGGEKWDDGVYWGIHRIIVLYGDAIHSIKIKYDKNGSPHRVEHGGSGGNKSKTIELEYPNEILTSISGYYDTYLRSLTFQSNFKKYGPFGSEKGTYFSFPNSDGKIVGFHGQSGLYLDRVGVHLSNFHVPPKVSQSKE